LPLCAAFGRPRWRGARSHEQRIYATQSVGGSG
jgi:hypothetical protein